MTAGYDEELALEQKYFDEAWDQRERARAVLKDAPGAAAGSQAATRGVRKAVAERLEQLPDASTEVAFGRFDPEDDQPVYVGKASILNSERDVLVVNWQAPAASPFYEATFDKPLGVERIRKFETQRNDILSFEDQVLAELARRIDELTDDEKRGVDDALLRDLEADRSGEMRDIVQTIHAAQYDLIRRPLDQLLVIQGGPGTGKTAVALHRASWLLFNHRADLSPEDILVIGPSKTFSRYIQKVLPGLGNEGVQQTDLRSLGPQVSDGRPEPLHVARLKGDGRMAEFLHRALYQRVRFPERARGLDVGRVSLSEFEVETQLDGLRGSATYNAGRNAMRDWIRQTTASRISGTMSVEAQVIDQALERVWPQLTAQAFLQELLGSRARITSAGGDDFTTADVDRLYRAAAANLGKETWSDADVALLDEADALINGRGPSYAHIIVDEAQDLSPMQLRSVRRRSTSGSCTIVGDLAQSTGPWARNSWADVIVALELQHPGVMEELRLGYRVPAQVMEVADRLLPLIAPGIEPATVVRRGPADPTITISDLDDVVDRAVEAASKYAGQGLFTGVICAERTHDAVASCFKSRSISFNDAALGQLSGSINLMTAEQSKGLEFDAIVVVEPADIAEPDISDLRHLYIALTRTTRYLSIVHARQVELLGMHEGIGPNAKEAPDNPPSVDTNGASRPGYLWNQPNRSVATQPGSPVQREEPPSTPVPSREPAAATAEPPAAAPAFSAASSPAGLGGIKAIAIQQTAKAIADEVRGVLGADTHAALVAALAEELGVSVTSPSS